MNPADPMAEVYQLCDCALCAARWRPLTENEITVLRFAAAVPDVSEKDRQQLPLHW